MNDVRNCKSEFNKFSDVRIYFVYNSILVASVVVSSWLFFPSCLCKTQKYGSDLLLVLIQSSNPLTEPPQSCSLIQCLLLYNLSWKRLAITDLKCNYVNIFFSISFTKFLVRLSAKLLCNHRIWIYKLLFDSSVGVDMIYFIY